MAEQTVLAKFAASVEMTCTLAGLASSAVGVGRQTTLADNSVTRHKLVHVYCKFTMHDDEAVTANTTVDIYLIKSDGTYYTDGAGASDAAWTRVNAKKVGQANITATTQGAVYYTEFDIYDPGPSWGFGIVQNSGKTLHLTAANHFIRYKYDDDAIQASA